MRNMGKRIVTISLVLIMCCIFLQGCSWKEASDNEGSESKNQEVENTSEKIEEKQNRHTTKTSDNYVDTEQKEVRLPEGFTKLTGIQVAKLPDIDGLTGVVGEVLSNIGVETSESAILGNYSNKSIGNILMLRVDVYVVADVDRNLLVHLDYSAIGTDGWTVFNVRDVDTGNYYYVYGKSEHDIYDYITGEIISLAAEPEIVEEVPHREGMHGISDKDVFDIGSPSTFAQNKVNNDVTGNWKVSTIDEDIQMVDYALSYYKKYFYSENEIHAIINFNSNTTTCIKYLSGQIYVTVYDYIDGEEHDANIMFTGTVLAEYIVYPDNGDIEKI